MARIAARADEVVEGDVERSAQRFERPRVAVDEFLRRDTGGLRAEHVLQRVVVGPAEESDLVTVRAEVTREDVGLHEFERVPDVRARVHVGNRDGDVRAAHGGLLVAGTPGTGGSACEAPASGTSAGC
jgi:hypothetical protein